MAGALSIGGGLLAGGAGIASSFLGGGGPNQQQFLTPGFGLTNRASAGEINTTLTRRGGSASERFALAIPGLATNVQGLREGLAQPGFGVRSRAVENRMTAAIGNLRQNLARRRLLGSSFGEDALARAEAEFGQAAGEAALQEVQDNVALAAEEARILGLGLQQELSELGVATGSGQAFSQLAFDSVLAEQSALSNALGGLAGLGGTLSGFGLANLDFGGAQPQEPISINRARGFPLLLS